MRSFTGQSGATLLLLAIAVLAIVLMVGCAARAETVVASSYGDPRDVRRTGEHLVATGQRLDPNGNFVAHRTLPLGSTVRLKHYHRVLDVVVNDRGPFVRGRTFDLTPAVNRFLQCGGLCRVKVEPWPPLPRERPDDVIVFGEEQTATALEVGASE